jgi:hypothetical protein
MTSELEDIINMLSDQTEYSVALQQFLEHVITGMDVPADVLAACPQHADLWLKYQYHSTGEL